MVCSVAICQVPPSDSVSRRARGRKTSVIAELKITKTSISSETGGRDPTPLARPGTEHIPFPASQCQSCDFTLSHRKNRES